MPRKETIAQKNKKKQPKIAITLNLDQETLKIIDKYSDDNAIYNRSQAVRQLVKIYELAQELEQNNRTRARPSNVRQDVASLSRGLFLDGDN